MSAIASIPILVICCFIPGFVLLRRVRLTVDERICGSIAASLIILYLIAGLIYLSRIDWQWCWAITGGLAASGVVALRDLRKLLSYAQARRRFVAFAWVIVLGLLSLAVIQHYSGGNWANDWKEHFQRAEFFLLRKPYDTHFIDRYVLPARPPMMHLIAAYFLAHFGGSYAAFQVISLFLNALTLFPCILLAGQLVRWGNRKVWLIAAFLITSPVFMQNIAYTWNKLLAAFFVILAIALYLRGWRSGKPGRIFGAAVSIAAAMLVHYSAGPYALLLGAHGFVMLLIHRRRAIEAVSGAAAATALLLTWFAWSIHIYGLDGTFASNTTVTGAGELGFAENVSKFGFNLVTSLVPLPFRPGGAKAFSLTFDQPNIFGQIRDYCFLFFQQSLPGSFGVFGLIAGIYLAYQLLRKTDLSLRIFWIGLWIGVILIGTAVTGTYEYFGGAHVCLQPLMLIGTTLLAAGFLRLPRWMRVALTITIVIHAIGGIVLQFRIESIAIPHSMINGSDIVPLSQGLPGYQAVCNALERVKDGTPFFGDHFIAAQTLILLAFCVGLGLITWRLAHCAHKSRAFAVAMVALLAVGVAACLSDRSAGYVVVRRADRPVNPSDADLLRILRPLQLAVETDPESADAHYHLAAAYYELGQLELCWQQLTRALLLDPDHEPAHYLTGLLGVGYGMGGASDINIVYNRTYLDSMDSHLLYGMTLFREGFRRKGISVLNDAAARYPTSPEAHRLLGAALFDSGNAAQGIAETVKALQLAPDSAPAAEQLRVMFKAQGMNENEAEVHIQALKNATHGAR